MQYTSNYNLMLPEGTDTVNLLTQMNPNTSDIDAAMFANKKMGVGRATEVTAGTVHAITRANQDSPVFAFTATSNWTSGDSFSVDGVACSATLPDGTALESGAYVINSEVLAIISGTKVTVFVPHISSTVAASDVTYDNTISGLTATNAQQAIDEMQNEIRTGIGAKVITDTITVSFTAGKTGTITSLSDKFVLGAELLGNALIYGPNVSGGIKVGYSFTAVTGAMTVDTGVAGTKTIKIAYVAD